MNNIKPDLKSEMDELQRAVQDLSRDDNFNVSVEQLVKAFNKVNEETLTNDIWSKLENTESNEIQKGDTNTVMKIAQMYNKTSPKILSKAIIKGDYKRPLIIKFGDRYHLVAGNTRLCTAAAIGVSPKVFIAKIEDTEYYSKLNKSDIDETDSGSSGSFEGPAFGSMIKRKVTTIHNANLNEDEDMEEATTSSSSGQFDVPAFGKTTKGGRRDPLKIDGPDSIYKGRAVTDKKFPKYGGPNGVFVKIKEKCKKFPYCNQGNTGALEFIKEDKELQSAINEVSKNTGIPKNEIKKIVLNEIKHIFI